jgi:hypothetical protein
MTTPDKLAAALRYFEMATEPKKMGKAREAFKQAHGLDLHVTFREAEQFVLGAVKASAPLPSGPPPELLPPLKDVVRILDAVRMSAGLGRSQVERLDKAKAAVAAAERVALPSTPETGIS